MYTGMAMVARQTGDASLLTACRRLWRNIVEKQLYITGGIGQTSAGEAFSFDYDLPNDTVYAETCASIGLVFFANEMLKAERDGNYADIMESALYNTVLAGMSKDGKKFFYVNPLETWPEACDSAPIRRHVKKERQSWFGCACCPPNVSRLLLSLDRYAYHQDGDTVYANLFIGGEVGFEVGGKQIAINVTTEYPHDGKVTFTVTKGGPFTLAVRKPAWCGEGFGHAEKNGFMYITKDWADGESVGFDFNVKAKLMRSNGLVRANAGKVAVTRGPLVYCAEEVDNGANLSALTVGSEFVSDTAGTVKVKGFRDINQHEELYFEDVENVTVPVDVTFTPYYLWGNRGLGEMAVWMRKF
jgi:hypothetical protein